MASWCKLAQVVQWGKVGVSHQIHARKPYLTTSQAPAQKEFHRSSSNWSSSLLKIASKRSLRLQQCKTCEVPPHQFCINISMSWSAATRSKEVHAYRQVEQNIRWNLRTRLSLFWGKCKKITLRQRCIFYFFGATLPSENDHLPRSKAERIMQLGGIHKIMMLVNIIHLQD